jgi:multiple sugar transport system permease protein
LAAGPQDYRAAELSHPPAGNPDQCDWLDAGFRTILHYDNRRTGESNHHVGLLDLHDLVTYFKLGYGATLSIIGGCVILASLAGFGLARFSIPYKEFFFLLLICGMMIPYQRLLTPLYIMFSRLEIQNTRVGLAIVHTAIQLPFSIFLMRHSFEAVPRELEEAAVIDGCNSFQLLWRIFLPSVVPGIVTVALFAFLTSWNEFIGALIFMNKESMFTLPIMLVASRTGYYGSTDWGVLQAGVIISIIPCVPVYLLLQKYYVSGLMTGAVK